MIHLHIGTHKTGTTAIQETLKISTDKLLEKGLYYDGVFDEIGFLLAKRSPLKDDDIKGLQEQIAEYKQDVVISSEGFMGDPNTAYSNIDMVAADAKKIFGEMKVYAYYRPQPDFIESWYAHLIKDGNCFTFKEWFSNYPWKNLRWHKLFSHYDNVEAIPYIARELEFLGIPITIGANPSINREGLDLAMKVNPYLSHGQISHFRKFLEENFRRQIGEKLNFISDELRKSMLDWFKVEDLFSRYHLNVK